MEKVSLTTLAPVIEMLKLHTRLFTNVIEGITEADAAGRLAGKTNHIAWLVGHTVSTRFLLAAIVGQPTPEPFPELFEKGKGIDESLTYPALSDLQKDWPVISEKVLIGMEGLTEEVLNGPAPFEVPIGDSTLRGLLTFFLHHEAYHIGQIGIARRHFGYEAMGYK